MVARAMLPPSSQAGNFAIHSVVHPGDRERACKPTPSPATANATAKVNHQKTVSIHGLQLLQRNHSSRKIMVGGGESLL